MPTKKTKPKKSKNPGRRQRGRAEFNDPARRLRLREAKREKERAAKRKYKRERNPTPEMRAEKAAKSKASARKLFERWLNDPRINAFLVSDRGQAYYGLVWYLKGALDELAKDIENPER